jgi:hypothetical protein
VPRPLNRQTLVASPEALVTTKPPAGREDLVAVEAKRRPSMERPYRFVGVSHPYSLYRLAHQKKAVMGLICGRRYTKEYGMRVVSNRYL